MKSKPIRTVVQCLSLSTTQFQVYRTTRGSHASSEIVLNFTRFQSLVLSQTRTACVIQKKKLHILLYNKTYQGIKQRCSLAFTELCGYIINLHTSCNYCSILD